MRCLAFLLLALVFPVASSAAETDTQSPAIKNVIGMLEQLVTTLDAETSKDEETFTHFSAWCTTQITDTGVNIERLQADIEETTATLGHLRAKKGELEETVGNLQSSLATEQQQLQMAMEKRSEEHSSFVREQQDFDSAISACGRASEVLSKHYGDGKEEPLEKPAWMSLVSEQMKTVRRVAKAHGKSVKFIELLQTHSQVHKAGQGSSLRQPNNERYQKSTGEALNVVDQIGELSQTFSQDKQSAINDENRLQGLFNTLQAEKTAMINQLTAELHTQTGLLTECNQEIADNEGKLARAERELKDDQAYLKRTVQLKQDATDAYNTRQADRKAEREAVVQAMTVLTSFLKPSFVQRGSSLQRLSAHHAVRWQETMAAQMNLASLTSAKGSHCPTCKVAASLLHRKAAQFHSELLQAAAMATEGAGNEAITEIVTALENMITRLKQDQRAEDEHKGWCDKELGITNNKVADHSSIIDHLHATLANLKEVLVEEKVERDENHQSEVDEDTNFDELTHVRGEEKDDFEHAHEETSDAIAALNQAIDILAKFYKARAEAKAAGGAFIQQAPGAQQGGKVVGMIAETRDEFDHAKHNLEVEEKSAEDEYADNRGMHIEVDGNIQSDENMIDTELQTTKQEVETNSEDLTEEEEDKKSTESYLDQLGRSCYMLINNYEDRKKRRSEESDAIKEAIKVLEEEA